MRSISHFMMIPQIHRATRASWLDDSRKLRRIARDLSGRRIRIVFDEADDLIYDVKLFRKSHNTIDKSWI